MDLFQYQDLKYKEFNDKIQNQSVYPTIGIRIPILRKIAREVSKNDYLDYINNRHTYWEEYLIHGLIIGYIKIPFKDKLILLDNFIPYIYDWALVDTTVSNLKDFKNNQSDGYKYILKLINGNTFSIRFGLVLLLDYYINDEYIDKIFDIVLNIKNDDYYVMMAKAWLLSYTYMKYKEKTIVILKDKRLSRNTVNKTISKVCDSYRVSTIDKEEIKRLRR
ncbi:MAG: DNA alkylation repair protein [Bacilli bacterium]|nr:DNA alkylation repair protein [Bacilli bacterium]